MSGQYSEPRLHPGPVLIVVICAIIAVILAVVPKAAGYAPYGEQKITDSIIDEHRALCSKFGFSQGTQSYSDCLIALADLRDRHAFLSRW
jgi:hypothetical protein